MRIVSLLLFLALIPLNTANAQLEWPACKDPAGAFEASAAGMGVLFRSSCKEFYYEDAPQEAISSKLEEWELIWNTFHLPHKVFKYELTLGASNPFDMDFLILDTKEQNFAMQFIYSPFIRIARSMVLKVPACHKVTYSFISPFPPILREVQVHFMKSDPIEEDWELQSDFPVEISIPGPRGSNDSSSFGTSYIHAEKPKIERVTPDDWSINDACRQ